MTRWHPRSIRGPNQDDNHPTNQNQQTPDNSLAAFSVHEDALFQEINDARQRSTQGHVALEDAVAIQAGSGSISITTAADRHQDSGFWDLWDSETNRLTVFLQAQQQNLEFSAKALLVNVEAAMQRLEEEQRAEAAASEAPDDVEDSDEEDVFVDASQSLSSSRSLASSHQKPSSIQRITVNTKQKIISHQQKNTRKTNTAAAILWQWRQKTDALVDACRILERFTKSNRETLLRIAAYADDQLPNAPCCLAALQRSFQAAPWKTGSTQSTADSALIVVLSDIYHIVRSTEERLAEGSANCNTSSATKWVAPSLFERRTTKYWVQDDQVNELLLAAVTEAPLLVYGQSGRLTSKAECLWNNQNTATRKTHSTKQHGVDRLWDELATPITSVYFDSPSMSLYKERLSRREGAQLLRARWYGRKPVGTEVVFLELKTHHEKWINTKSVKERVAIRECDMVRFLDYNEEWTLEEAQEVVSLASTNADVAQSSCLQARAGLQRDADRLWRMKQLVVKHALRPCVRTCYLRAAFQSPNSNALRLTIDRNITMIDEGKHHSSSSSWCLPEDAVIQQTMAARVPFVILEVKLSSDDSLPPIMLDLQQRGVIEEAAKFSKFLTGAATFNLERVGMLPYWAEHPAFAKVFGIGHKSGVGDGVAKSAVTEPSPVESPSNYSTSSSATTKSDNTSETSESLVDKGETYAPGGQEVCRPPRRRRASSFFSIGRNTASTTKVDRSEDANRSVLIKARNDNGGVFGALFRRRNRRSVSQPESVQVASKRPARVEPKSYFANERTFIQWISAALLLVTISVILLGIDSSMTTTSAYARKSGIGVCCGAVVIVIYATYVYFRRLHLLSTGNAYGYIDHVGPFILAVSVSVGVCVLLIHFLGQIEFARQMSDSKIYLHEEPGQCYLHSNLGISKLEYQPSDIVVDSSRNMLMVPSLQRIVSHSLEAPLANRENRVKTLIEIPDSNIEGLTVVDDRVFALSEGPKKTELIELAWSDENELSLVHRWKLSNTEQAEGLTYVPDKTRRSGRLFVDVNRRIHIYEVPEAPRSANAATEKEDDDDSLLVEEKSEQAELERIGSLNNHVLTTGLNELKISSMFYFEGIAYILHDNEILLRAWDLDEGDLLAEIPLPRVEGGFSKEWEGVALERRTIPEGSLLNERNYSLRGSDSQTKNQLIMHLALDTPAQVWSMAVEEGATRGGLILPSCAVHAHAKADSISEDESSDSLDRIKAHSSRWQQ